MTAREKKFWQHFDDRASSWRDGCPDLETLSKMTAKERGRIEAELLSRLASRPTADSWVHCALGELGSKTAEPLLVPLLNSGTDGTIRVAAAAALWRISRRSDAVVVIVDVLLAGRPKRKTDALDSPRIDAAVALGYIDTEASRAALEQALTDPNYLVASNAKSALRILKTGEFDPWAELAEGGWTRSENPDGSTTFSRPAVAPKRKR